MKEETKVYHVNEIQEGLIGDCLTKVIAILEERGYDAMTQLVGYLMSGDPGYITSHEEARNMIMRYDRSKILEFLIHQYMDHK